MKNVTFYSIPRMMSVGSNFGAQTVNRASLNSGQLTAETVQC